MPVSPFALRMHWNLSRHLGLPWASDGARSHILRWCESCRLPGNLSVVRSVDAVVSTAWYAALHDHRVDVAAATSGDPRFLQVNSAGQAVWHTERVWWTATADGSFDPSYVSVNVFDASVNRDVRGVVSESEGRWFVSIDRDLPAAVDLRQFLQLATVAAESPHHVRAGLRRTSELVRDATLYTRALATLDALSSAPDAVTR